MKPKCRSKDAGFERKDISFQLIKYLYRGVNGNSLSRKGKERVSNPACKSLTYGEIVPQSFAQILELIRKNNIIVDNLPSGVFVDLGCGLGRAVMCAALSSTDFERCWGIELLSDLTDAALDAQCKLNEWLDGSIQLPSCPSPAETHTKENDKVIDKIASLLSAAPDHKQSAEVLANVICAELGHKTFKNTLKKYNTKKFTSLLKLFPELFTVTELLSDVEVGLIEQVAAEASDSTEQEVEPAEEEDEEKADSKQLSAKEIEMMHHIRNKVAGPGGIFSSPPSPFPLAAIEFTCGDIFEIDWWSVASVVYCASLLFTDDMMERLSLLVCKMNTRSWFVSLKPLAQDIDSLLLRVDDAAVLYPRRYTLFHESFFKMSWQMAKVYIYQIH